MATQNPINNTIADNNFTVPNGSITASGGITSTLGTVSATVGAVTAGTMVVAGTGVTATTGNITASAGNVVITAGNLTLPDTNTGGTQGRIIFGGSTYIQDYPTGSSNFMAGFLAGNTAGTLTGQGNNGIGGGVFSLLTSGASNTAMGHVALQAVNTGSQNVAIGSGCFNLVTSGANNTGLGYQTAQFLATGSNNLLLGTSSGSAYVGAESNNIILANAGVAAENAKIRIGTNATHTATYIAGIDGVNVGSTAKVVTLGTAGTVDQLGTATITAGTGITVTPGANTITIATSGSSTLTYTNVNTTPYVVLSTDDFLGVDCSGAPITIQLPNAPSTGRTFVIKDRTGSANTNAITVTTVGGVVNIDGATSYTMNTQYAAIEVLFDGSTYQIF